MADCKVTIRAKEEVTVLLDFSLPSHMTLWKLKSNIIPEKTIHDGFISPPNLSQRYGRRIKFLDIRQRANAARVSATFLPATTYWYRSIFNPKLVFQVRQATSLLAYMHSFLCSQPAFSRDSFCKSIFFVRRYMAGDCIRKLENGLGSVYKALSLGLIVVTRKMP